ncbi:MAG: virulence factor [Acidiferrobacterales bacterium]|nr:virulence factor [Acidiferrobacterales bacterium]
MANLITVYWRDIPAQVMAKERRTTAKVELSPRFADAIDRAAMRGGAAGTDAYLEEWRRETTACGADLQAEADAAAAKLEEAYDKERLLALIKNEGRDTA